MNVRLLRADRIHPGLLRLDMFLVLHKLAAQHGLKVFTFDLTEFVALPVASGSCNCLCCKFDAKIGFPRQHEHLPRNWYM